MNRTPRLAATLILALALVAAGCGGTAPEADNPPADAGTDTADQPAAEEPTGPVVVYSGRNEELIGPILDRFEEETGIELQIKYGSTSELAVTLLEEGDRSPADLFIAQDAGALGALAKADRFAVLPDSILNRVDERFRSPESEWVGLSGRARVVAYNTEHLSPEDLPDSIWGFTDPQWKGRIGWPPSNGSFQAFVTALRVTEGEERAREWLEGIMANEPKVYPNNTSAVAATAAGEVDVAFVNHYYLYRFLAEEGESFQARNYHLPSGDAGAMINVAGAGILSSSENKAGAEKLLDFLLSNEAQTTLVESTYEYPLVDGVALPEGLTPLDEVTTPDIDLSDLDELDATLELLREVGAL